MLSNIGWFSVVLVTVSFMMYDSTAHYSKTLALTNSSCTDLNPFPDPTNTVNYYQCFQVKGTKSIFNFACATGGLYDADNEACVGEEEWILDDSDLFTTDTTDEPVTDGPVTTDSPPVTTDSPVTDPTTIEDITTQATTTDLSTTEEPTTTTTDLSTTEEPTTTTTDLSTTEESTTQVTTEITTEISTTEVTTESPTTSPVTTESPPRYFCSAEGLFPDPQDPSKYYRCIQVQGQFYYYIYTCPLSSCYDKEKQYCVVNSCPAATTTLSTSTLAPTTISTSTMNPTSVPTSMAPTTISTLSPTSIAPTTPAGVTCTQPGNIPDSGDCTAYYKCALVGGVWYSYHFFCPIGSYYNESSAFCTVGACPAK